MKKNIAKIIDPIEIPVFNLAIFDSPPHLSAVIFIWKRVINTSSIVITVYIYDLNCIPVIYFIIRNKTPILMNEMTIFKVELPHALSCIL